MSKYFWLIVGPLAFINAGLSYVLHPRGAMLALYILWCAVSGFAGGYIAAEIEDRRASV